MAKSWWEDEGFSDQMLALGMGLLSGSGPSTDPANRSLGAAIGKGGMAMLAQMQQQKQNKMNERRLGMEEKTLAMKQAELEQQIAAAQAAAEQQRVFRGRLTGAPADFVSSGGDVAGGPPLKVSSVPAIGVDPSFEAMLTPPQRQMLASMPMDKAAAMAEKLMTPGETKFYTMPNREGPVALRQTGSGIYIDEMGNPVVATGIKPYKEPKLFEMTTGVKGLPKSRQSGVYNVDTGVFSPVGDPYSVEGQTINVGGAEKDLRPLAFKNLEGLQEAYRAQLPVIDAIKNLESLESQAGEGKLTPWHTYAGQVLNSFGIPFDKERLAADETYRAQINSMVISAMAAGGGARGFTEKETQMLMESFPLLATSKEARDNIRNIYKGAAERAYKNYNEAYTRIGKKHPEVSSYFMPPEPFNVSAPKSGAFIAPSERAEFEEWKKIKGEKR